MTLVDAQRIKESILKFLTTDFEYGKRKDGNPLKRPHKNQALFDPQEGWQVFGNTTLGMVMCAVELGVDAAIEEQATDAPKIVPRRLYIDDEPNGYMESDRDFMENNRDACIRFLEQDPVRLRDLLDKETGW